MDNSSVLAMFKLSSPSPSSKHIRPSSVAPFVLLGGLICINNVLETFYWLRAVSVDSPLDSGPVLMKEITTRSSFLLFDDVRRLWDHQRTSCYSRVQVLPSPSLHSVDSLGIVQLVRLDAGDAQHPNGQALFGRLHPLVRNRRYRALRLSVAIEDGSRDF